MVDRNDGNILIVITDEKESTKKDEETLGSTIIVENKKLIAMRQRRIVHFGKIIEKIAVSEASIIKTMGDSLLIRLHSGSMADFITKLFCVWNNLKTDCPIRVAVHLAETGRILTGNDLKPMVEKIGRNIADLKTCWPCSEHIEHDIFGPDMNLAARIAKIPDGALFVISSQVLNALKDELGPDFEKDNLFSDILISEGIPIVFMKGIS